MTSCILNLTAYKITDKYSFSIINTFSSQNLRPNKHIVVTAARIKLFWPDFSQHFSQTVLWSSHARTQRTQCVCFFAPGSYMKNHINTQRGARSKRNGPAHPDHADALNFSLTTLGHKSLASFCKCVSAKVSIVDNFTQKKKQ